MNGCLFRTIGLRNHTFSLPSGNDDRDFAFFARAKQHVVMHFSTGDMLLIQTFPSTTAHMVSAHTKRCLSVPDAVAVSFFTKISAIGMPAISRGRFVFEFRIFAFPNICFPSNKKQLFSSKNIASGSETGLVQMHTSMRTSGVWSIFCLSVYSFRTAALRHSLSSGECVLFIYEQFEFIIVLNIDNLTNG